MITGKLKLIGMRKALAYVLVFALILGAMPVMVSADEPESEGYVTIRIEAGGHGVKGEERGIETILDETVVLISELPSQPKAIDAINQALVSKGLEGAVLADESGWFAPIAFGGVTYEEGYDWDFIYNDAGAMDGVSRLSIKDGDSIVMYLTGDWDSGNYREDPHYSYFARKSTSFDNSYGSFAEVSLVLKHIILVDWEGTEDVVANAEISVTTSPANDNNYECDIKSDEENGTIKFSCWGLGEYIITAKKVVDGVNIISRPYCKITLTENGVIVSANSEVSDTGLKTVLLDFENIIKVDGKGYLNDELLIVNNTVNSVGISAVANDSNAEVSATYKSAKDKNFTEYNLTAGDQVDLEVGDNLFKLKVINDADVYIHTLTINREPKAGRDIDSEITSVIRGVEGVKGFQPVNDWILALNAAGMEMDGADKTEYLSSALYKINEFAYLGKGSVGSLAKIAIALTSLGVDIREIQDPDALDAPINLFNLIANYSGAVDIYSAPYVLSLYDLVGPDEAHIYPITGDPKIKRADLINTIISTKRDGSELFDDVDYTGMVFTALAPYYLCDGADLNGIETEPVKAAVDKAIEALSNLQSIDGGFGSRNSSTTATVITGLTALEINPHNDDRFIKIGSTLITDLLSFRTSDDKLGYTSNKEASDYSCTQGFQALAAYQNLEGSRSSNIYHFPARVEIYKDWPDAKLLTSIAVTKLPAKTVYELNEEIDTEGMEVTAYYNANANNAQNITDFELSEVKTSSPGTKVVTVSYQEQTATFNITVKDEKGSTPKETTVKITIKSGKGVIAADSAYVVEPGKTSVMDVLKAVLSNAGKDYVIRGGAYVAEIDGLGEFSGGSNSGWKYYIGADEPLISAKDYKLEGGESIQWIYTLDFTKDEGSEKWGGTPLPGEGSGEVTKESINSVLKDMEKGKKDSLTVNLDFGAVKFDKDALTSVADQMKGDTLEITIESVASKNLNSQQTKAVAGRPVYDIRIVSGKKEITKFDGKLTISIPYKLKEGEKASGIVVYYLNDAGELIPMEGYYDAVTGNAVFTVNHLSYYVIGYDEALVKWPFTDVAEDDSINWFYTPVKYVYEKGIFSGTGTAAFSPNSPLTRSMLASVLARLSKADLANYKEAPFGDVDMNSWYGPSVAWAKEVGIISGYKNPDGSYSFKPDANVSRQDIAVMVNNYNKLVAKKTYEQKAAVTFTDNDDIAEYAKDAVTAMQQSGIINGMKNPDGSFRFMPLGNATRAEAATMIYNMLTLQ